MYCYKVTQIISNNNRLGVGTVCMIIKQAEYFIASVKSAVESKTGSKSKKFINRNAANRICLVQQQCIRFWEVSNFLMRDSTAVQEVRELQTMWCTKASLFF